MTKKILVIDDDEDILEPISLLLAMHGYAVDTSSKGQQTHTKAVSFKPDLILLDVLMSGSDGRTICRQLKNQKNTKEIPVILMSAHPGANKDSLDAGANDFIAKPFETELLLKKIEKYIQNTNAKR